MARSAALALLACAAASAQTQCAPGSYLSAPSTCTPCSGSTYSLGGTAASCASCAAGDVFVSSAQGCAPGWGSPDVGRPGGLYLSGSSGLGLAAANVPGGQSGPVLGVDHLSRPNSAVVVTTEFYQTGPLPQLPTGGGARTLSAWVNCNRPLTPTGPTLLELGDAAGGSPVKQSFTVRGAASATYGGTTAFGTSVTQYTSQAVAGLPMTGTCVANSNADGVGTNAGFYNLAAIRRGPVSGNIYIVDRGNFRIRKLVPATATVTTLVGSGTSGAYADGVGTNARLQSPYDLFLDPAETFIVFSDAGANRIRYIDLATGNVSTIAGIGTAGALDGVGTNAYLNQPWGLAPDFTGSTLNQVYIVDRTGLRVRRLTWANMSVTTIAGSVMPALRSSPMVSRPTRPSWHRSAPSSTPLSSGSTYLTRRAVPCAASTSLHLTSRISGGSARPASLRQRQRTATQRASRSGALSSGLLTLSATSSAARRGATYSCATRLWVGQAS